MVDAYWLALIPVAGGLFYLLMPHLSIITSGFGLNITNHVYHQLIGIGFIGYGAWKLAEDAK